MTDKDLDELLKRKVKEENNNSRINIEKIFSKAKKNKNIKVSSIAASFIILLLLLSVIILNNNINFDNMQETILAENYGIINIEASEELGARVTMNEEHSINIKEVINSFSLRDTSVKNLYGVVLAKVKKVDYTTYDIVGMNNDEPIYDYVSPKTLADIEILSVIDGNIDLDSIDNVHSKGGIVEYKEFLKFLDKLKYANIDLDMIQLEYNQYINDGKENVYVSYFGKDRNKLEEGKSYLMVISKKDYNIYWVESYNTLLLEYDEKSNTVLLNGEYVNINEVLK